MALRRWRPGAALTGTLSPPAVCPLCAGPASAEKPGRRSDPEGWYDGYWYWSYQVDKWGGCTALLHYEYTAETPCGGRGPDPAEREVRRVSEHQHGPTRVVQRGWRPYFWVSFAVSVLLSPVIVIWAALLGSAGLVVVLLGTRLRPDDRQLRVVAVFAGLALSSVPYLLLGAGIALSSD